MCAIKLLILCSGFLLAAYTDGTKRDSRTGRLFSFNTVDDDIAITLEFSVPFLTIPVKRTMDSALGLTGLELPMINVNPASLVLGGAIVLGTTVLIPLVIKTWASSDPQGRYSRLLDQTEFGSESLVDFAAQMLSKSQGFYGCPARVACFTAQRSPTPLKDWSLILSNNLVSSVLNSSVIEDAMISGRQGRDCSSYKPCPLSGEHVPMLMHSFFTLVRSTG